MPDIHDKKIIKKNINTFEKTVSNTINYWKNIMETQQANNKKTIIWGSGSKCISFLHTLKTDIDDIDIVDINPYRQGKYLPGIGKQVLAPESINFASIDLVIVMNNIYLNEIRKKTGSEASGTKILALD
ncbi:MAG TPA: hypothetical protein VJ981_02835 [Gammaproteobacteria bacterium]|nr:hypothetical protein [Gammaproteobacteria bacterium]